MSGSDDIITLQNGTVVDGARSRHPYLITPPNTVESLKRDRRSYYWTWKYYSGTWAFTCISVLMSTEGLVMKVSVCLLSLMVDWLPGWGAEWW